MLFTGLYTGRHIRVYTPLYTQGGIPGCIPPLYTYGSIPGCIPPWYTHREAYPGVYRRYTLSGKHTRVLFPVYASLVHPGRYPSWYIPPCVHPGICLPAVCAPCGFLYEALGSLFWSETGIMRFSGASQNCYSRLKRLPGASQDCFSLL